MYPRPSLADASGDASEGVEHTRCLVLFSNEKGPSQLVPRYALKTPQGRPALVDLLGGGCQLPPKCAVLLEYREYILPCGLPSKTVCVDRNALHLNVKGDADTDFASPFRVGDTEKAFFSASLLELREEGRAWVGVNVIHLVVVVFTILR